MISLLSELFTSFVLGLLTPLTAVCVIPLYPAFLIYLSNKISPENQDKFLLTKISLVIVSGVLSFMFILGLIFSYLFKISLTSVIGIVSPIAFFILLIISIFLILNKDFSRIIPQIKLRNDENKPLKSAYLYGFFFGAIVVPCNPLFIALLFARVSTVGTFTTGLLSFVAFGLGIGAPLIAFSLLSTSITGKIISFITKNKKAINRISGIIMFLISLYYLLFVFKIL